MLPAALRDHFAYCLKRCCLATLLEVYSKVIVREAVLDVDRAYTGCLKASNRSDHGNKMQDSFIQYSEGGKWANATRQLHNDAIHESRPGYVCHFNKKNYQDQLLSGRSIFTGELIAKSFGDRRYRNISRAHLIALSLESRYEAKTQMADILFTTDKGGSAVTPLAWEVES